jgi:hypothetical protein
MKKLTKEQAGKLLVFYDKIEELEKLEKLLKSIESIGLAFYGADNDRDKMYLNISKDRGRELDKVFDFDELKEIITKYLNEAKAKAENLLVVEKDKEEVTE